MLYVDAHIFQFQTMFVTKFFSAAVDDIDGEVKPTVVDDLQGMSRSDTVVSDKIEFFSLFFQLVGVTEAWSSSRLI